jgi:hypothetical protein
MTASARSLVDTSGAGHYHEGLQVAVKRLANLEAVAETTLKTSLRFFTD